MKRVIIVAFLLQLVLIKTTAQTKEPELITIDQLQSRISSSDTAYVVNFWATWCVPCVEEMPLIENIPSKYQGVNVKVLLISLDLKNQISKRVIPFIDKHLIMNEVFVLNEPNPNNWIPKINKDWSGAIPAFLFFYNGNEVFHEGQVTPELIDGNLSKVIFKN